MSSAPSAAVQAWDTRWCVHTWGRGWAMCGLFIFSHLPLFSTEPTQGGWASGKGVGGGYTHLSPCWWGEVEAK